MIQIGISSLRQIISSQINAYVMHSSFNISNFCAPQTLDKTNRTRSHSQTFNRMWGDGPPGGPSIITTSGSGSIRKLVWFSYGVLSSRVVQSVRVKGPRPASLRAVHAVIYPFTSRRGHECSLSFSRSSSGIPLQTVLARSHGPSLFLSLCFSGHNARFT